MILSRLILNPRSRQVQIDISNLYEFHRSLMTAFPDQVKRKDSGLLYRVETARDPLNEGIPVLVQSSLPPDWMPLEIRTGYLLQSPVLKKEMDISSSLNGFYKFYLRANPTRRISQSGKLICLQKDDQLLEWLVEKGKHYGFEFKKEDLLICKMPACVMHKPQDGKKFRIEIQAVDFSGQLKVTEKIPFSLALQNGIGRGRSFGCGLLSLARL